MRKDGNRTVAPSVAFWARLRTNSKNCGGADEIHRHEPHAFVYVLEGSLVMQLHGAEPVTLKACEGF